MYLFNKGITDADQMTAIWQASEGIPLFLSLLTFRPQDNVDPTSDVVTNFLHGIPQQESAKRQLALDAALLSRPFNQDDLQVFTYVSESDRPSLYQWLTKQPFVRSRLQDGRYLYHDVVRNLFSRYLCQRSQKHYEGIRGALAIHYQGLLEKTEEERGKEAYRSEEWLEQLVAVISQLLLLPDQACHIKALERILHASYEHTDKEQNREIVRALSDLSQKSTPYPLSPVAHEIIIYLLCYINADHGSYEWLEAGNALLKKVIHAPAFPSTVLAKMYYKRGRAYNNMDNKFFDKKLAIDDFQQALTLFEEKNYFDRGFAYFYSGNYREALAIYEQALEDNPQDADAYFGRGWAYLRLQEYQRAVDDFEHVLELAPSYQNPGGLYNGLRQAYYDAGKYQPALSANDHYIEEHPRESSPYAFRGSCYFALGNYQCCIEACTYALELDPSNIYAYYERGFARVHLREYQLGLADFDHILELDPRWSEAYNGRGWAYYYVGEHQQAIEAFNHLLQLKPAYTAAIRGLGLTYYQLKEYSQALTLFDRRIELKVPYPNAFTDRSRCYQALQEYQRSIQDCNEAIELASKGSQAYFQRGLAYLCLKDLEQARADFTQSYELEPTRIASALMAEWTRLCLEATSLPILERLKTIATVDSQNYIAHICQGVALLLHRNFKEALVELEKALLIKQDRWEVYFWKGIASAFLEQDEEAIPSVEKALDFGLPPTLLTPLHWFEQERPKFYEKFALPLLTKYE
ncbi:tetratricopeptide repeat protein [Reticulibacter mediterranei]|nr:tetratricopeptide repeat protein [Reticulibacter mediterranei]